MTSQGTAHGRFIRAAAESAMRELGERTPISLADALDYLELLAAQRPDRFDRAAIRWHGRLESEIAVLTLAESQLALAALGSLRAGDTEAVAILRRLLRRVSPSRGVRVS